MWKLLCSQWWKPGPWSEFLVSLTKQQPEGQIYLCCSSTRLKHKKHDILWLQGRLMSHETKQLHIPCKEDSSELQKHDNAEGMMAYVRHGLATYIHRLDLVHHQSSSSPRGTQLWRHSPVLSCWAPIGAVVPKMGTMLFMGLAAAPVVSSGEGDQFPSSKESHRQHNGTILSLPAILQPESSVWGFQVWHGELRMWWWVPPPIPPNFRGCSSLSPYPVPPYPCSLNLHCWSAMTFTMV